MIKRYGRIRPRALKPGAAVYLFAPSGAVKEPYKGRGKALLVEAGYEVICGQSLDEAPAPFAAGPAAKRLADWHACLSLHTGALLPARGGYGAIHLLPYAPLAETAAQAPLWIGSSDCTYLQTALLQQHGLVTFYGPMPCGQLSEADEPGRPAYCAALAGQLPHCLTFDTAQRLTDGTASGELRGGCLSILASLCGTPWQLDGHDALLILEDIGEHPFRVERMLRQLHLAGCFAGCRGILFGMFPGCSDNAGNSSLIVTILKNFVQELNLPALFGVPTGHGRGAIPLPLGIPAKLENSSLFFLEELTL